MDVLILAAGRGDRLRPITDRTPKPLLEIAGKPLIEHHIERLVAAGHRRLAINLAHLGEAIEERLGDGSRLGARVSYSREPPGALETGGGIVQALNHIQGDVFAAVNGDIWTDFPYASLPVEVEGSAWLVLVDNPPQHSQGDFVLTGTKQVRETDPSAGRALTFAGIAVYRRSLFEGLAFGRYPLLPILLDAIRRGEVAGTHYRGIWMDVGTPERLEALRAAVDRG